ncbi:MAG: hypothetical protein ACP5UM_05790 [Anaerolineae bacterium]
MERLKRIAVIGLVAFSATLSVLVLKELSTDATAMLIGAGFGLLSSVPVGIGLLIWSLRAANTEKARPSNTPVIIVTGGSQALPGTWTGGPMWTPPREFLETPGVRYRVLGDPGEESSPGWGGEVVEGPWSSEGGQPW